MTRCKKCGSSRVVKNGSVRGIQRFRCKKCTRTFQKKNCKNHSDRIVKESIELYNEGLPFRAIARVKSVGKSSVQNWILQRSRNVILETPKHCKVIELDELQFFLGNRTKRQWLWLAVCRDTKLLLGLAIGGRAKRDFKPLWQRLRKIPCAKYGSDGYQVYDAMLPKPLHHRGKQHTYTIEGMMSIVRHFLARFRRRTRCYSKSLNMVQASVLLFAQHWNTRLSTP